MNRTESMVAAIQAADANCHLAVSVKRLLHEPDTCLVYVEQQLQKLTTLRMNLEFLRVNNGHTDASDRSND